jgi:hypothetical protein
MPVSAGALVVGGLGQKPGVSPHIVMFPLANPLVITSASTAATTVCLMSSGYVVGSFGASAVTGGTSGWYLAVLGSGGAGI